MRHLTFVRGHCNSRARSFVATYGQLVQVEVEAVDPDTPQGLVLEAVFRYIDFDMLEDSIAEADRQRATLHRLAGELAATPDE